MAQTLFYIPETMFGLPVFGVGLLLVLFLVTAGAWLIWLFTQGVRAREVINQLPMIAILAVVIAAVLPRIVVPHRGLPIRGYGTMLFLAVVLAVGLTVWRGRRYGFDLNRVLSMGFLLIVSGIAGARVFFVIEYWDIVRQPTVAATVASALNIAEGGLVVYGAIIGGALALAAYVAYCGESFFAVCDLLAPSLALGMAIGRLGCFLNGCCFGGPCELPWAVEFPPGSPPYWAQLEQGQLHPQGLHLETFHPEEGAEPRVGTTILSVHPGSAAAEAGFTAGMRILRVNGLPVESGAQLVQVLAQVAREPIPLEIAVRTSQGQFDTLRVAPRTEASLPVHPTQIYSSINAFLLFAFLMALSVFARRPGILFATFVTLYAITRFLLEAIRTDEPSVFGTGLSISQNISLLVLCGALALWGYLLLTAAQRSRCAESPAE